EIYTSFLMIRRPPRSTQGVSSAASDVYKRQNNSNMESRGMVLYINRNTRTTKGNFVVREITEDSKGYS
ncbi:Csa1 family protein, partial [Staphylococcus aureus]